MPLAEQIYAFLITVLIGLVVGFCYDFYFEIKRQWRLKKIGTAIGDFLFWIVITIVVFGLLVWGNWGEIRLYVFLGLGFGMLIYLKILSRCTVYLLQQCFSLISRLWLMTMLIVVYLWKVILLPVRLAVMIVSFPFHLLSKVFSGITTGAKVLLKRFLKPPVNLVKRKLRSIKNLFKGAKPK